MPSFITGILEEMGWTDGALIPVSSEENKHLEFLLDQRNRELLKLKAETEIINAKQNELEQHKTNLLSEHRENMHLLWIHKDQNNNEEHLVKVTVTETGRLKKEAEQAEKTSKELGERGEKLQAEISRLDSRLKKKGRELGEDGDAIMEWRTLLKKGEEDISTIEKFSKGDAHQIEVIDDKRRRLKLEHDKKQTALAELCANLLSEEKAAERLCNQVSELLAQRRDIISTWTEAVKHLRQRDKDITRMKVELDLQRAYAKQRDDHLKEKTDFLNEQYRNNAEAERELEDHKMLLSRERQRQVELNETVKTLNSEYLCLKRQVMGTAIQLSNCRMDNKRLLQEKTTKEDTIQNIKDQIEQYRMKLKELQDTTKTSEQRMRQLEEMLRNEERYTKQVIQENERLQQCVFKSQQSLAELLERESIIKLAYKGYKLSIAQSDVKCVKLLKDLSLQDEVLYKVSYNLLDVTRRTERIEGSRVDPEEERQLEERRVVLEGARAEREGAVRELNSQLVKLAGDERRLAKAVAAEREYLDSLTNRSMELAATAEGAAKEYTRQKRECRSMRAEEAALALRAQHAERAVRQLEDRGLCLEKAALGLKTAVMERCAEAAERITVLQVQKRCMLEEKNILTGDINFEKIQADQLKAKYEIYLASLGKDESGEPLSLTYFKLKNAQEKNELQQQGDALDVSIRKSETEIAALEATLHVLDMANRNFARSLGPAQEDDPEMQELKMLNDAITSLREQRKKLLVQCRNMEQIVEGLRTDIESLDPREESITGVRDSLLDEISLLKINLQEQREKIRRAEVHCNTSRVRARRRLKDASLMEAYRADIECRMVGEANRNAVGQLRNVEGLDIEEKATKWGINLGAVHSGAIVSKRLTLSNASEQGSSLHLESPCSSRDSEKDSVSPHIRSKLLAVRTVRSPLVTPSPKDSLPSSDRSIKTGRQNLGCSVSIGVVNLDLDVEPVRESSTLNVLSRSLYRKIYKDSSKSTTSKKGESSGTNSSRECK